MNKIRNVLVKWFEDRGYIITSNLGYGDDTYKIMIQGEHPNRFEEIEIVIIKNNLWIYGIESPNALSKNIDPYKIMHLHIDNPDFFVKLGMLFPDHYSERYMICGYICDFIAILLIIFSILFIIMLPLIL